MWDMVPGGGVVVGACHRCGAPRAAVGLVPVPDRVVFGRWVEGGWFCEDCKPRVFGRVGGHPPLAQTGHTDWVAERPGFDPRPRLVKRTE